MSPRLGPPPTIVEPARAALVTALYELVAGCRFGTLRDISEHLKRRLTKTRISELARGTGKFPEVHEVCALARACDPAKERRIVELLHAARAERSALAAAPVTRLEDFGVTGMVGAFRDWARLGIHRPITPPGTWLVPACAAGPDDLPAYVQREADLTLGSGLRAVLAEAASGRGAAVRLVVICGESLAGKTRTAFEAMRAELAAWRLFVPHSAARMSELLDNQPPLALRHTVVWLDEIDQYLTESGGPALIRRLLGMLDGPIVVLGTLRTDREILLRDGAGWALLDRSAHRITLKRRPPRAELDRELARARELDDPRIVEALDKIGSRYGIAEWLAAGPQLLRELDRVRTSSVAVERVAGAIVDAAIDCYRGGYITPCPRSLLFDAHLLYLDDPTTPTPPEVFDAALERARQPVAGAAGLLEHHRGRGDRAFDYLLDQAEHEAAPQPHPRVWNVLLSHITVPTLISIALAAHRHRQPHITAEVLSAARRADQIQILGGVGDIKTLTTWADSHDRGARQRLAELLFERRDVDGLTGRANRRDHYARERLADLLLERGDLDTLTALADTDLYIKCQLEELRARIADLDTLIVRANSGDISASYRLAALLAERGDVETLTVRADAGDHQASQWLAKLLATCGDMAALTDRAKTGDLFAAGGAAQILAKRGDVEGLTTLAEADNEHAKQLLAMLLAENGELDLLAVRAAAGDRYADSELADVLPTQDPITFVTYTTDIRQDGGELLARLLFERGDLEGLAAGADKGNRHFSRWLAKLLAENGDLDALTTRANTDGEYAGDELVELLAARQHLTALASRADSGHAHAAIRLAELLAAYGELDILTNRADSGDQYAARELIEALADRGDLATLTAYADAGKPHAAVKLAMLLARVEDVDTLTARANTGDRHAAEWLAELLTRLGDIEGLAGLADGGNLRASRRLAQLLFAREDLDALTARANAGDGHAARRLASLLAAREELDTLTTRANAGDIWAHQKLGELFRERADLEALASRADAGDTNAAQKLAERQAKHGDLAMLANRADAGDTHAAHWLAREQAKRDDVASLTTRADTGDRQAIKWLAWLLAERGDLEALIIRAHDDDAYAAGRLQLGVASEHLGVPPPPSAEGEG